MISSSYDYSSSDEEFVMDKDEYIPLILKEICPRGK
jgi:hypothetical protein